ncbi:two-component system response regulator RegX3 [Arthrobacter woluwensis]|uniref:response regulator transcription factor n=1 Tax=Arthrobacter woluwensis TaxID=156980 RepID=UPI00277FB50E|nr:response regulator transcription factor [Arthrobacter woluwensis]MDQ0708975.1 two-component system response regulator RegX3 [Arthrobacter woluwensis]
MDPGTARVMVVEDDPTVRMIVSDYLRAAGYAVAQHADGASARDALRDQVPDVLIVDRMMPGLSGDELCREVRTFSDVPIMMLTAMGAVEDRIEGLEHGADDYLSKPFALRELQLRVAALARRRVSSSAPSAFTAGRFRIDPAHRRVWADQREVALTTREYELFLYLVQHPDQVVSRDEILREVWGWGFGDPSTVTVHVRRLREKIEPDPRFPCYLRTEWGAGYRFTIEPSC